MALLAFLTLLVSGLVLDRDVVEVRGEHVRHALFCQEREPRLEEWSALTDSAFREVGGTRLQFGEQSCWVVLRLPVQATSNGLWYVQNGFAPLDRLKVCLGDSCSAWVGSDLPFSSRSVQMDRPTIPVELPVGRSVLHLVARDTSGSCNIPLHMVPQAKIGEWAERLALFDGAVLGILLVLFLASLAAASVFRSPVIAVYALLLGILLAYIATHSHVAGAHLWPEHPWVNHWAQGFLKISMTATMGVFAYLWLHLGRYDRRLAWLHLALVGIMYGLAGGLVVRSLGWRFLDPLYAARLPEIVGLTLIGLGPLRAVFLAMNKHRRAREFLWANLPLGITGFWSVLHVIDGFGASYFVRSRVMLLGPILEASLLGWFLFTQLGRQRLRQRDLLRRHHDLEKAQTKIRTEVSERERRGLARDLHDDLGQRVAGLRLLLEFGEVGPSQIQRLREEMQNIQGSLRDLTRTMHPHDLERGGLPVVLQRLRMSGEVELILEARGDWETIPSAQSIHLYRIIQECWSNAIRHGQAREFRVEMEALPDRLSLRISDDGEGFDPARVEHGIGLTGIRERVAILEGECRVESAPGEGVRWWIQVPRS